MPKAALAPNLPEKALAAAASGLGNQNDAGALQIALQSYHLNSTNQLLHSLQSVDAEANPEHVKTYAAQIDLNLRGAVMAALATAKAVEEGLKSLGYQPPPLVAKIEAALSGLLSGKDKAPKAEAKPAKAG